MDPSYYESLLIPIGEGVYLRLEEEAPPDGSTDGPFAAFPGLPDGWMATSSRRRLDAPSPAARPPLYFDAAAPDRGLSALRLFELRDYAWELQLTGDRIGPELSITSSLEKSNDRDLWKPRKEHGRFRFVNYLGSAWIEASLQGLPPVRIAFEVASPKLDYEQEYRSMVEAVGAECQQLLLEWGTPASLNLSADPAKQHQTLLEQFLFLRHVLGPEKLDLYLEIISRRPHSRLERELAWKPAGTADPALFISDPLPCGRHWRLATNRLVPSEIMEDRKFDSTDTPPNRFVKFALQSLRNLCQAVLTATRGGKPAFAPDDAVTLEALSMLRSLEAFLALPLFTGVGELRRIPFESTALQRREGYREILLAWLMLDAAAQLDWPGREDAYDGTTRDVATLYEYWLYFLLVRAFRDHLGMISEQDPLGSVDGALPFCCRADDGRLVINLKQREASFARFRWERNGHHLRVHFFYNRSFRRRGVGERGTYSKTFRPDYTLVIIPEEFSGPEWRAAEQAAEAAGRIAYLHFDAKYRGENLPGLFGASETEPDDPDDERLRAAGTVKNVDLYKMHTYNEAIRRTVGSYVLYPGTDAEPEKANARFERYHEVVPGIGAFAVRPKKDALPPDGLPFLVGFIDEILNHQLNRFTQSYRITTVTEDTIRETPLSLLGYDSVAETVSLPAATVVMGYMKQSDIEGFAQGKFFYCRATDEDGSPLTLDISAAQGAFLLGWSGPIGGPYRTTPWMARISSCRLVHSQAVKDETGRDPSSGAVHFLLFKLVDLATFHPREVTALVLNANKQGKGGRFRTFQTHLKYVMQQQSASASPSKQPS